MKDARNPLAFISYRRADSSAASRWLAQTIARTFGTQSVFIDTESIRIAEEWPDRINDALASATILIPVIGPNWLRITDEHGRRRLDNEDDWVRNEIRYALTKKLSILPLLLSDTPLPRREAFPEPIASLSRFQAFELRDDRWESDLSILLARLSDLGFERISVGPVRYPSPKVTLKELTEAELSTELRALPGWTVVASGLPGNEPKERTELYRSFEFASFEDAVAFMGAAVPVISEMQHHPRWENTWRTVSVWLSTWDIGHKPSRLDVDLARYLEGLRLDFAPPRSGRR